MFTIVVRATLDQLDLFQRLKQQYPRYFTPPANAEEAENQFDNGYLVSPAAIEGLHQIGNSISTLRLYHQLGVRYATLTWNCHNIYADAAIISDENGKPVTNKPYWHGVSHAGRTLIKEMNRLGMLVDLAHVSPDTMRDVLGGSKGWNGSMAPPIFSHSSAYAICPHPRNVPDDILQLVKRKNSIVMVNFSPDFISCVQSNSSSGLPDLYEPNVTLSQVVRHITHIGNLIGYDHVGIGTDYDGIIRTPRGLEDVSKFPALVTELLKAGVSDQDAAKIVGRNLLRVWKEADTISKQLQKEMLPVEDDLGDMWYEDGVQTYPHEG
jgi:membrane dipeptidase